MTSGQQVDFQRARSPEQREARRQAILAAAVELLAELPVSEISLRELSRRVGLSKTNVVRYFETREAVFFALLNQSVGAWVDELPAELPPAPASVESVMRAWARSLAGRRLLCELLSALGTELERNISAEAVRDFKLELGATQARLARVIAEHVPGLSEAAARELVATLILLTAGLWPFANPSPAVTDALGDPRLAASRVDFAERLGRALHLTAAGLLATGAGSAEVAGAPG